MKTTTTTRTETSVRVTLNNGEQLSFRVPPEHSAGLVQGFLVPHFFENGFASLRHPECSAQTIYFRPEAIQMITTETIEVVNVS